MVDTIGAEWNELAAHASEPNPFAERWFVEASLRHLRGSEPVRLIAVRAAGRLIGIVPLCLHSHYGRLPIRNVQNWQHYHSFLGNPLLRAGEERAAWSAILDLLDRADWAAGFLHLTGIALGGPVEAALVAEARARGRGCDLVQHGERALLATTLSPEAYYETTVRKKKRKELKRLQSRLAELGKVETRRLAPDDDLREWCDAFLALERSGWKGRAGSALASDAATDGFFREALAGAHAAGRLQVLRMELDGRPIAMLVNFLTPPGSSSFKIAFDEELARFSPGVLIQLENYAVLDHPGVEWMDSCAAENHPMINSLWGERRSIGRVTVELGGRRRRLLFRTARAAEDGFAAIKRRLRRVPPPLEPRADDD